jgi:hypothetical protein
MSSFYSTRSTYMAIQSLNYGQNANYFAFLP